MKKLLHYLFDLVPGSPFNFYIPLLIIAGVLIISGVALKKTIQQKKDNKIFRKLFINSPDAMYWIAILILLNLFGRNQRFPLLGARFVLYATLLWLLYFLYTVWRKYKKQYPKLHQELSLSENQHSQYTTQKKKKR